MVVLGNGPSLRGFDFERLSGVHSLGMNAAYRYWDRIGWYPTHYCCLDPELIATHHAEIARLVREEQVETAFLNGAFLDHHPDAAGDDRYVFLDQFNPHWFEKRGKAHGLIFHDAEAFLSDAPSKITTGSHAVRYAAWLGYERITILGIDLRYVEVIPEARAEGELRLVMTETPAANPNYFFDDYQQAGDTYQVPNPAVHDGNLHLQAFEALRGDYAKRSGAPWLTNSNPRSLLQEKGVLPFAPIDEVLGEPALGAVVVPMTPQELPQLLADMTLWSRGGFAPSVRRDAARPRLLFSFPRDGEGCWSSIEDGFAAAGLDRYFAPPERHDCGLSDEDDRYERRYEGAHGRFGYKSGPNMMFFESMRAATGGPGRSVFLMEADCVPCRAGWLDRLEEEAEADRLSGTLVSGSVYTGEALIRDAFLRHLNGNALYAVGDPDFAGFLDAWEARLAARIEQDGTIAYDCVLEEAFSAARPLRYGDVGAGLYREHAGRLRASRVVANVSHRDDAALLTHNPVTRALADPATAFVHGGLFARAAAALVREAGASGEGLTPPGLEAATARITAEALSADLPKLAVIDITAVGGKTATGALKATYLGDWPEDRLLQVKATRDERLAFSGGGEDGVAGDLGDAMAKLQAFEPDVLFFRPVLDSDVLSDFQMRAAELSVPSVIWLMDDWPARTTGLPAEDRARIDRELRRLLDRSTVRWAISASMKDAFETRYGVRFGVLRNAVAAEDWPVPPPSTGTRSLTLRYGGGLAADMTLQSVLDVAKACGALGVRVEIDTQRHYLEQHEALFEPMKHVTLSSTDRAPEDYRRWLSEADILLLCYNFDEETVRYARHSFANKAPELLASGKPVLLYGPAEIATVATLAGTGAVQAVTTPDLGALRRAIGALRDEPKRRRRLGEAGRAHAFEAFDLDSQKRAFRRAIRAAAAAPMPPLLAAAGSGVDPEAAASSPILMEAAPMQSVVTILPESVSLDTVAARAAGPGDVFLCNAPLFAAAERGITVGYGACLDTKKYLAEITSLLERDANDRPRALLLSSFAGLERFSSLGGVFSLDDLAAAYPIFAQRPRRTFPLAVYWSALLGFDRIELTSAYVPPPDGTENWRQIQAECRRLGVVIGRADAS